MSGPGHVDQTILYLGDYCKSELSFGEVYIVECCILLVSDMFLYTCAEEY